MFDSMGLDVMLGRLNNNYIQAAWRVMVTIYIVLHLIRDKENLRPTLGTIPFNVYALRTIGT